MMAEIEEEPYGMTEIALTEPYWMPEIDPFQDGMTEIEPETYRSEMPEIQTVQYGMLDIEQEAYSERRISER